MFFDVDQSKHASIKKNCARNKLNSSELKKVEDPLQPLARCVRLLSSQNVQRCVTTSDLWMADPFLPLSVSYSLFVSVTSTPVGLTLLNKASSKMTPSCLSALLCNKSFIKHRGARRSISNHRDWELMCVSARVSVFSPFYHWVVGRMLLY